MNCSIFIYKPFNPSTLNFDEIKKYISRQFPYVDVIIKDNILRNRGELAEDFAKIRVANINEESLNEPLPAEINYEKKALRGELLPEGMLYDGFEFKDLLYNLIGKENLKRNNIHIFITNRLIGTFDGEDKRYHARTNILGVPSIISLSGIVEAPAKPKEFYLLKQKNIPVEVLKEKFKGRFIDYNDERMTKVVSGLIIQSIFYHVFGEGFCENKNCRLYNAHWQEELINTQLGKTEFCDKHRAIMQSRFFA